MPDDERSQLAWLWTLPEIASDPSLALRCIDAWRATPSWLPDKEHAKLAAPRLAPALCLTARQAKALKEHFSLLFGPKAFEPLEREATAAPPSGRVQLDAEEQQLCCSRRKSALYGRRCQLGDASTRFTLTAQRHKARTTSRACGGRARGQPRLRRCTLYMSEYPLPDGTHRFCSYTRLPEAFRTLGGCIRAGVTRCARTCAVAVAALPLRRSRWRDRSRSPLESRSTQCSEER